jgi:DNA repair protein RadC
MQTLRIVRRGRVCETATKYCSPVTIFNEMRREMSALDREHFIVLHLDGKNRLIARETISIGSLNQSIVHPREVFKAAILNNSAALVLIHNHPSGDPAPSYEDIEITNRLVKIGEIAGIKILDHIVFGDRTFCSFNCQGLLPTKKSDNGHREVERLPAKAGNSTSQADDIEKLTSLIIALNCYAMDSSSPLGSGPINEAVDIGNKVFALCGTYPQLYYGAMAWVEHIHKLGGKVEIVQAENSGQKIVLKGFSKKGAKPKQPR